MKRVLSLVLALVLVLGMIPTFAAEGTGGELLKEYGFITGGTDGDLMEAKDFTREELAAVMSQLYGLEEDAKVYKGEAEYSDVDMISDWALPYVAFNEANGWMQGRTDGSFDPKGIVTGQELAALLLKVLGYEFDWATAVEDAAELDLIVADEALTRGAGFEAIWTAVSEVKLADEDMTLGVKLEKLDPPAPVVVDLEVESVTALNLKEMVVKFNKAVDKTTAQTAANYVITTTGTAATPVATLAADGMTVNIVLGTKATQQEVIKLQVKDVKDADGTKMTAQTFENITFFDATVPTADSIELTGPTTFEVTFSEVMAADVPTVLVNNGIYGATFSSWDGNTALFTLSAALTEGDYTVKVSGAKDAAGYTALAKEFTLNYVKDVVAPVASVDSATQLKVTFKFDEKVKNVTANKFYHTFSSWTALSVETTAGAPIAANDFVDTVVVVFATTATNGHPLVAGANSVTVIPGAAGAELQDLWGNKLAAAQTFGVEVSADVVAPTVTKVEATDENILKVTFDEAVAGATTAANYTIYKADGTTVTTAKTVTYADKVATLTFVSDLAAGSYTVKISNVTDTSIYANKIVDATLAFEISDLTAPTSITAEYVVSGSNYIVYVTYPELMDTTTTLVKANYQIGGAALATADTIEMFGNSSKVKITTANNPAGLVVAVKNVKDASGNAIGLFTTLSSGPLTTASAPAATKITTKSLNTIEVTFNKHLSAAPAASFTVDTGAAGAAVAVAAATYVNNDDTNLTSTVTLVLHADENLLNEGDVAVVVNIVDNNVKSFTGAAFVAANNITATVVDGIAPKLVATTPIKTVDLNNDGQIEAITVTYTEDLADGYFTPATYTVAGYTVTGVTENNGVVTIAVTPKTVKDTGATPVVTQVQDLFDDVTLNKLAASAFVAVSTTDSVVPFNTIAAQTVKGGANATFQVSETGTAYLVSNALAGTDVDTVVELDALVTAGTATKITVSAANTDTTIAAPAAAGTYALVAVDAVGLISAKSANLVTVDNTVPTVATPMAAAGAGIADTTLVFSEELSTASKTAVKAIVDAALTTNGDATVTTTWTGATLTIDVTNGTGSVDLAALTVPANFTVTDIAGNVSAVLVVADLQN